MDASCVRLVSEEVKSIKFDNFEFSYYQNNSLFFLCERWIPCQSVTSVLCLHSRPETVHCSTKDAYTSEITFLALHPWFHRINLLSSFFCVKWKLEELRYHKVVPLMSHACSLPSPSGLVCWLIFEFTRLHQTLIR